MTFNPEQELRNSSLKKVSVTEEEKIQCSLQYKVYSRSKICHQLSKTYASTLGQAPEEN